MGAVDGCRRPGHHRVEFRRHACRASARPAPPASSVPILIGGGVTADNVATALEAADAVIVSTSLLRDGAAYDDFKLWDKDKVLRLMDAAQRRYLLSSEPQVDHFPYSTFRIPINDQMPPF